jgi:hypothetical protein
MRARRSAVFKAELMFDPRSFALTDRSWKWSEKTERVRKKI